MTNIIDITGRQAENGNSYTYVVGKIIAEIAVILHIEVDPAYYEQVRKELLLTARKYAHKSSQSVVTP